MILGKIPGFRSGRKRNKVIAVIGYIMMIIILLAVISSPPDTWDKFVDGSAWVLLFLGFMIPVSNLFNLRKKFYLLNRSSIIGKFFGYAGYIILCFVIFGAVNSMESASYQQLKAEQAAKDAATQQAEAKLQAEAAATSKAKADADAKAKAIADATAKAQANVEQKAKAQEDAKAKADADAKAKADADEKAKAEQEAKQKADQAATVAQTLPAQTQDSTTATAQSPSQPAPTPAPPVQAEVKIVSIESPVPRNGTETVVAQVPPGTTASIEVDYASGPSHAAGLEDKTADSSGRVSWSWHVGGRTTLGSWPVTVSDNGASDQASFEVVH